jgi:hypothetical protein
MESFDQSLKYLLEPEPSDFIRLAMGGGPVEASARRAPGRLFISDLYNRKLGRVS